MASPFAFLAQYAIQAPLLLVWLVGMALALLWWQRAPKVALVTCVACGLFLLDALIGTFIIGSVAEHADRAWPEHRASWNRIRAGRHRPLAAARRALGGDAVRNLQRARCDADKAIISL